MREKPRLASFFLRNEGVQLFAAWNDAGFIEFGDTQLKALFFGMVENARNCIECAEI